MSQEISFAPGLHLGDRVEYRKTVSESDVYLFAGITGDLANVHVDEEFMRGTRYGHRIAHGVLLTGFTSTASTMMASRTPAVSVSLGYDRVRFVGPVFFGDTVTTDYEIAQVDEAKRRTYSNSKTVNQHGVVCAVATHILQFLDS